MLRPAPIKGQWTNAFAPLTCHITLLHLSVLQSPPTGRASFSCRAHLQDPNGAHSSRARSRLAPSPHASSGDRARRRAGFRFPRSIRSRDVAGIYNCTETRLCRNVRSPYRGRPHITRANKSVLTRCGQRVRAGISGAGFRKPVIFIRNARRCPSPVARILGLNNATMLQIPRKESSAARPTSPRTSRRYRAAARTSRPKTISLSRSFSGATGLTNTKRFFRSFQTFTAPSLREQC